MEPLQGTRQKDAGPKGRRPVARSRPRRTAGRWFIRLTGLGLLLVLPGRAGFLLAEVFGARVVLGYLAMISVVTVLTNRADKRQAGADQWRTPERTLHLLELLGGWPAAFVTQRVIRHKTAKAEYQVTFWLIVALHQYLALDFVQDWKWTGGVIAMVKQLLNAS